MRQISAELLTVCLMMSGTVFAQDAMKKNHMSKDAMAKDCRKKDYTSSNEMKK